MRDFVFRILHDLIDREGGYVNHPDDLGGPTRWGITQSIARANGYEGPMEDLPRELALDIYRHRYWLEPKLNQVAEHSTPLAAEMLDSAVLMGPAHPIRWLQRALNALNRRGRDYADINADGVIGPATIGALAAYLARRSDRVLVLALNGLQIARLIQITEQREANEEFLYGWLSRRAS